MNVKQRRAHVTIWSVLLVVLLATLGAVLIARQRLIEALGGG